LKCEFQRLDEVDHLGVNAVEKVCEKHEKAAMFAMAVKC
jgi:hypothetical protein